jgi:hypothetical protein
MRALRRDMFDDVWSWAALRVADSGVAVRDYQDGARRTLATVTTKGPPRRGRPLGRSSGFRAG